MDTARQPQGPSEPAVPRQASFYKLAYEQGLRTLDDQRDELNGMRGRASQFLAFVGSATAFLVGTALSGQGGRDGGFYLLAILATGSSVAALALVGAVLFPRWNTNLRISSAKIVTEWIDSDMPVKQESDLLRALANKTDEMRSQNEPTLKSIRWLYLFAIVLGSVGVLLWAALAWSVG